MSKNAPPKTAAVDLSRFCKSTFTLTFAIEVLGIDVWHDCNEGWLDLGPCAQGMKIQYQLYPGQNFEVDILIWPHAAKIWCGSQYGWVRTWQFLERRFLTFSITHIYPVRVMELRNFTATITPIVGMGSLGANAKNDKNVEVFLPSLKFNESRYFAPVVEGEELSLTEFILKLVWEPVAAHIPANFMDNLFDIPQVVTDVRHQDTIMFHVKEAILNTNKMPEEEIPEPEEPKMRDRRESKVIKKEEKKKVAEVPKVKFEVKLQGDAILAGIGRVVPFEKIGDRPPDLGEIIAVISSNNLPAQDDMPVFFINVEGLSEVPVESLKKLRISQIYTRWVLGDEVHDSEPQNVRSIKNDVKFNDHHAMPMDPIFVPNVMAQFLDIHFEIQLRGIRLTPVSKEHPKFFGYQKGDHDFGATSLRKQTNEDLDFLIAVTKIDGRCFSRGVNKFLRGEYPLFPPVPSVVNLEREGICTNDINLIRAPLTPNLVVPPHMILQAQMTLEVSMGLVGCKPKKRSDTFSRLYSVVHDSESIIAILKQITEINEEILQSEEKENLLTGFSLDAGNIVLLYVEGPSDHYILKVWEMTEDLYPKVKPVFSTSARYPSRLYPELLEAAMPFYILKMYVPMGVLLACPPVYARPALPLPTRSAILKLGRLISGKMRVAPCRFDMPTAAELKSFRLELCVTPKPVMFVPPDESQKNVQPIMSLQRINWDK
ncbi:uncharacterized protein LOC135075860 [Ostrinia nubilalis]|uniref:uncharacterized protein LOC135075860 n=1 Tax=Ostrinia nubilalis TaxID=29057 RepID=UPI0030825B3A